MVERSHSRGWQAPALLAALLLALVASAGALLAPPRLARGRLLVASPRLADPNFAHSVVLLLEVSEEGTLGVVLNRPGPGGFMGGPVDDDVRIWLARRCTAGAPRVARDVCEDKRVDLQVEGTGADPARLRAYDGHAGWEPGQLEREVARGDWSVLEGSAEQVFSEEPLALWERLSASQESGLRLLDWSH
jgi:putative transcriptional regulator